MSLFTEDLWLPQTHTRWNVVCYIRYPLILAFRSQVNSHFLPFHNNADVFVHFHHSGYPGPRATLHILCAVHFESGAKRRWKAEQFGHPVSTVTVTTATGSVCTNTNRLLASVFHYKLKKYPRIPAIETLARRYCIIIITTICHISII